MEKNGGETRRTGARRKGKIRTGEESKGKNGERIIRDIKRVSTQEGRSGKTRRRRMG